MTRRLRPSDRSYPVDRASDRKEGRVRSVKAGGVRNEWLNGIRTPTADERATAAAYLVDSGNGDLLAVLGLAS